MPSPASNQPAMDLTAAQKRIADLERELREYRDARQAFFRMASFPEQNPNMVIEITVDGEVTYTNPVARQDFPDLSALGEAHPLLTGLREIVEKCRQGDLEYVSREIDLEDAVYEQKICIIDDHLVHVYAHNITALKRAEESVNEMAGQLRMLAQRVVLAQEQERKRIAQELHDEAGQALVALKISLEILRAEMPEHLEEVRQNLKEAIGLADATRNHIRLLAQGLRPPVLDTLGIELALEEFCQDFGRWTNLPIDYRAGPLGPVPEAVKICLYRCLQEALTNIAQHAGARSVQVELGQRDSYVTLRISDDGSGIPGAVLDTLSHTPLGIGLLGMRERVELLEGSLEIQSDPGAGTRLIVRVPLGESV